LLKELSSVTKVKVNLQNKYRAIEWFRGMRDINGITGRRIEG